MCVKERLAKRTVRSDSSAGRLMEIERVDVAHGSGSCTPSADGLILDSKNAIQRESLRWPPARLYC